MKSASTSMSNRAPYADSVPWRRAKKPSTPSSDRRASAAASAPHAAAGPASSAGSTAKPAKTAAPTRRTSVTVFAIPNRVFGYRSSRAIATAAATR
jgi:hypothetical protein